jgi:hypothetical protein
MTTPVRLKLQDLDTDTMLALMNVSESEKTSLYMAQVTQIFTRCLNTAGEPFKYQALRMPLEKEDFNLTQMSNHATNALEPS